MTSISRILGKTRYSHDVRTALSILFAFSLVYAPALAFESQQDTPAQQGTGQAQMLQGQVGTTSTLSGDLQNEFGFRCAVNDTQGIFVTKLIPATPAIQSGIQVGDRITDAHIDRGALDIGVERDGQFFRFRLTEAMPQAAPKLVALQPKMDVQKPYVLNAEQTLQRDDRLTAETGVKIDESPKIASTSTNRFSLHLHRNPLADYRIELLVDRSKSMHNTDCPEGLSRWQWVGMQAADMANALAPLVPNGFTIIPFATEYDVFEHATVHNINNIFGGIQLQYGTRLYEPLVERLDHYFLHRTSDSKPLLIVIVTDGEPFPTFERKMVRNELIATSHKMTSPDDVAVIFCQIGNDDPEGRNYLLSLDNRLVSQGARYHFVHTLPFEEIEKLGLGQALTEAIKQYGATTGAPAPLTAFGTAPTHYDASEPPRPRDVYVDNPRSGPAGERHYDNGRLFDLAQISVDYAASICNQFNPVAHDVFFGLTDGAGGVNGAYAQEVLARRRNRWARKLDNSI